MSGLLEESCKGDFFAVTRGLSITRWKQLLVLLLAKDTLHNRPALSAFDNTEASSVFQNG
jgi:hypothetical protein